jgi:hypothetical protein
MYWTRLDTQGAPIGQAVMIGAYPNVYARAPIVALGDDTLALLGDSGRLDLVHISSAGAVGPPTSITIEGSAEQKMVLAGSTPFASWLEYSGTGSFVQDTPGNLIGRATLQQIGP